MNTKNNNSIISIRTDEKTGSRLSLLAKETNRSRSALIIEALDQYVSHQDWLATEIERGVAAAERGELVKNNTIATWISSLQK